MQRMACPGPVSSRTVAPQARASRWKRAVMAHLLTDEAEKRRIVAENRQAALVGE